jgi:hypothetical protein
MQPGRRSQAPTALKHNLIKEAITMEYGLCIRNYGGLYCVDFSTPSVGMSVYATTDKKDAERELQRLKSMNPEEFKKAVL